MYQKESIAELYKNNTLNDRGFGFVPEWKFTPFRNTLRSCESVPLTSLPFLRKFLVLQY